MLSFDITDRNIRVVRGVDSGSKVRVISGATLNLEEEVIVNGYVRDVPRLATLINDVLTANRMVDKDVMVCISSNITIFKELKVHKASKEAEFQKMVKAEMYSAMNIDDSYGIAYVVANAAADDDGMVKVFATACPNDILDGYKDVFKMLMMNLKSMSVGCTSIAKVILADPNIKKKQPALAVQIDDTFISLNTFEDSQLAFSRFASISPEDYGNSEDYVFEAVSENINRMLQFHRARGGKETIGNVILYGDTGLFERIRDFLNEMEVHTEIITAPSAVSNHESLDFPAYANAVGALFKRDKVKERVNLLEGDLGTSSGQMGNDATYGILLLSVLGFVALMCSFYGLNLNNQNKELESQISSLQARIDAAKPDLDEVDRLEGVKSKVLEYKERAINALDAYDSTRDWNRQMIEDIDERLRRAERRRRDTYGNEIEAKISTISMSGGTITFPVEATENRDSAKKFPTEFMEQLEDLKLDGQWLESATYAGYSTATVTQTDEWGNTWETVNVRFSVTLKIKSWVLDSIPPYEQPVPEDDAPADAALAEEGEV